MSGNDMLGLGGRCAVLLHPASTQQTDHCSVNCTQPSTRSLPCQAQSVEKAGARYLQGSPGAPRRKAGQALDTGSCCVGCQQRHHKAMDVMQGQGMQQAITGIPCPSLT